MSFQGWPAAALEFFEGLEADNSKSYWQAHKDVYEHAVKAPMDELLTELEPEFGEGRLFRPYRDIRFSKDKTPYKTSIAATIGEGYVNLSADGLRVGAGMYHMAPDQLERYREAVSAGTTGERLAAIVDGFRECRNRGLRFGSLENSPERLPEGPPKSGAASVQRHRGYASLAAG